MKTPVKAKNIALTLAAAAIALAAVWTGCGNDDDDTKGRFAVFNGKSFRIVEIPGADEKGDTYALTTTAYPAKAGDVLRTPERASYKAGTLLIVCPKTSQNHKFTKWTDGKGTLMLQEPCMTVTMDSDKAVIANFEERTGPPESYKYTLTTATYPAIGGNVERIPDLPEYERGATVVLCPVPERNYDFKGWTGDVTSEDPCVTVKMDGDKVAVASFRFVAPPGKPSAPEYKLTTTVSAASPKGSGTVSPAGTSTREAGTQVSITATPNEGYEFTGWSGASDSKNVAIIVVMIDNMTLTANFQKTSPPTDGFIRDPRDGKSYRTVKIGNLTWMAENLNYADNSWCNGCSGDSWPGNKASWCYDNDNSNCARYGRLYTWNAAMNACPAGWRLPNNDEWVDLVQAAGGKWDEDYYEGWGENAGKKLKSKTGWEECASRFDDDDVNRYGIDCDGTDEFGFSALPGGGRNNFDKRFLGVGEFSIWWSASDYNGMDTVSYVWGMGDIGDDFDAGGVITSLGYNRGGISVRCVQEGSRITPATYMLKTDVNPDGAGTVSRSPNQTSYASGTRVTVTAKPNEGSEFEGWWGGLGTDATLTITMNFHQYLNAYFQPLGGINPCFANPGSEACCTYNPYHSSCYTADPCLTSSGPGSQCCNANPYHSSCYTVDPCLTSSGPGSLCCNANPSHYSCGTPLCVSNPCAPGCQTGPGSACCTSNPTHTSCSTGPCVNGPTPACCAFNEAFPGCNEEDHPCDINPCGAGCQTGSGSACCNANPSHYSCVVDEEWYSITINKGKAYWMTGGYITDEPIKSTYLFYKGDTIAIYADIPAVGYEFDKWTFTPANLNIRDRNEANTIFIMPAGNVTLTATYKEVDFYDGEAKVRYTWEAAEQGNILAIAASFKDVKDWFDYIYSATNYIEDATDIPLYDGSPLIPDNVYSSTLGSDKYKGVYLPIEAGNYTAVCSVDDVFMDNIADIVANYKITINKATATADGKDKWFEVAFDVGMFLAGEDDLGWFGGEFDNPNAPERLKKRKASIRKFSKRKVTEAGTIEITYYVIHRAKK